jgi:allophanate hydrolase
VDPVDLEQVVLGARAAADTPDQGSVWIALATEAQLRERVAELRALDPRALPLYGLPFAVKDNIDVAGWPTTAGCPAWERTAERTAPAVARLLDAGAVLIGKTNLDQFATGLVGTRSPYGTPRNALDPALVPGGSSSGSAVAVATDVVVFALGTDTAGSGRVPAALNGIVGLKPTRGLVSMTGVVPACRSLDCVSVFARDVGLAERVLDVMQAPDPDDPYSRVGPTSVSGADSARVPPRIGVPELDVEAFEGDHAAHAAFEAACAQARAAGATLVAMDATPFLRAGELLYEGPWLAERAAAVGGFVREQPDAVLPVTRTLILRGFEPSAVDSFTALYELEALRAQARACFASIDALLLPTIPTLVTLGQDAAEPFARNALLGRFMHCVNLLDLAAISVPGPARSDGGPAGITLAGPAFSDAALTHIAANLMTGAPLLAQAPAEPDDARIELLVVGAHMRGLPLEHQLRELGASPLGPARTARGYRMLALEQLDPPRPGLVADPAGAGGLAGELWELPAEGLGLLLTRIVEPLSLGPVRLADDRHVVGFLCSAALAAGARDITIVGGWRAYLAQRDAAVA